MKIPYERQHDNAANRMCGAASIVMVLRSFNKSCSQDKIWEEIKDSDESGRYHSKTHKVCQSFLKRGFKSLHLFAKNPINLLKLCQKHSVRVILGHRINNKSKLGHFTVFRELVDDSVIVNDPELGSKDGKGRKLETSELLDLMDGEGEVAGNSCIVITNNLLNIKHCGVCDSEIPLFFNCRRCDYKLSLEPTLFIGCINYNCSQSLVNAIYCLNCNFNI